MNNGELIKIAQTLNMLARQFQGRRDVPFKFLYGLKKNLALVNPPAQVLNNRLQYPPTAYPEKLEACENERMNICIEYATKDENGLPIIKGNMYDMSPENVEAFTVAIKAMMEKYPEIAKEREDHEAKSNELLSEGADDIEFYKINLSHFPADGITLEQIEILRPLIDEVEESKKLIRMV